MAAAGVRGLWLGAVLRRRWAVCGCRRLTLNPRATQEGWDTLARQARQLEGQLEVCLAFSHARFGSGDLV